MPARLLSAAMAAAALVAALALASRHPLSPAAALGLTLGATAAFGRWPLLWLSAVPALLPLIDLAPWTGWTLFGEWDLLVLAALAGGHARRAVQRGQAATPRALTAITATTVITAVLALLLLGLAAGVSDATRAGGVPLLPLDLFARYTDADNTLRVSRALLYALLAAPLLGDALRRSPDLAVRCLLAGLLTGLAGVSLAALAERAIYPGLLRMGVPYRTTALFWEMHVGGAAIDAFLALTVPLLAWGWRAGGPRLRIATALLALLAGYAALTTFSRGVYLALAVALAVLAWRRPATAAPTRWRRGLRHVLALAAAVLALAQASAHLGPVPVMAVLAVAGGIGVVRAGRGRRGLAGSALALALLAEGVLVFPPAGFMATRVNATADDGHSRYAHWRRGVGLLHGAGDWLFGLGAGRLPAHYAAQTHEGQLPGDWQLDAAGGNPRLRLQGPRDDDELGGLVALSQPVPAQHRYTLRLRGGALNHRGGLLLVRACVSFLLYEGNCQQAQAELAALGPGDALQPLQMPLFGAPLDRGNRLRRVWLSLSAPVPGSDLALDDVELLGDGGRVLPLRNGDFGAGLAHWLPRAHLHFLPWHIDNLALELLIERGLLGLAAAVLLAALALHRVTRGAARHHPAAPALAASLCSLYTLGAVSSVLDVPRVAFAAALVLLLALQLPAAVVAMPTSRRTRPGSVPPSPAG